MSHQPSDRPGSSDIEARRDHYSPQAISRSMTLVRWLHEHKLSNPLYMGAASVMMPWYYLLTFVLNRTRVLRRERLPRRGTGFFLLSNHISMLDGQILSMVTFPRAYWYPSKAAFYRNTPQALAYTAATGFKSFPVRRGERDLEAVELMEDLLSRGESVMLFPEGTRSRDGTLGRGKKGVGKIIHDTRPLVVPAYLEGFDRILTPGRLLPRLGEQASVIFGDPVRLDDFYQREPSVETSQGIADRVMEAIADLRDELRRAKS